MRFFLSSEIAKKEESGRNSKFVQSDEHVQRQATFNEYGRTDVGVERYASIFERHEIRFRCGFMRMLVQ